MLLQEHLRIAGLAHLRPKLARSLRPFTCRSWRMKITLITVCFNSHAHIGDALASVDQQTHPDIEHLVVDGASTDGTQDIVRANPKPWRELISEPDDGIYDAMNKGIRRAEGEVIGFINSDDLLAHRDVLQRVAEVFDDPNIDACFGDLCYVKRDDVDKIIRYWRSSPYELGSFERGWCPPHPTLYIRRRLYQELGGFDLRYRIAADWELMARFVAVHRIRTNYIPEVLVKMRMGGTTNRSLANIWQQNREIWQALNALGLHPSLLAFAVGKILSRGAQFVARPN